MKKFISLVFAALLGVTVQAANPPYQFGTLQNGDQLAVLRQGADGNWTYFLVSSASIGGNTNALTGAQQAFFASLTNLLANGGTFSGTISGNGGSLSNLTATFLDTTGTAYVNGLITTAMANNGNVTATVSGNVMTLQITNANFVIPTPLTITNGGHSLSVISNSVSVDGNQLFYFNTNSLYVQNMTLASGNATMVATNLVNGGWTNIFSVGVGNAYRQIVWSNSIYYLMKTWVDMGMTNNTATGLYTYDGTSNTGFSTNFVASFAIKFNYPLDIPGLATTGTQPFYSDVFSTGILMNNNNAGTNLISNISAPSLFVKRLVGGLSLWQGYYQ